MNRMLVIADDLTGAADCASSCAAFGMSATVVLHTSSREPSFTALDSGILCIDANTRCLPAAHAARVTADLVRQCRQVPAGRRILFKKIDSTLRGHIAAELAAVTRLDGKRLPILMAPALPSQSRATIGGCQLVRGRRLEQTDLWRSEARAPQSEIPALLAETGLSCGLVGLATVRAGAPALLRRIGELAPHVDVVVCDAETDADLAHIARASLGYDGETLCVGSAGFASQLPRASGVQASPVQPLAGQVASLGPALFVVGSGASIAREQAQRLAAETQVLTLALEPGSRSAPPTLAPQIDDALRQGRDVLVLLGGDVQCSSHAFQSLLDAVSASAAACASSIGAVVATGGETARALLDALAIPQLRLCGEVEPGVPLSLAEGWTRPLPVITKAGAFGGPSTLVRCSEFLKIVRRASPEAPPPHTSPTREG